MRPYGRLSKKVCSPLGPLCEGAPPAGGGGENCTAARNISGYGKFLSLRPFGAPPSQREVFDTLPTDNNIVACRGRMLASARRGRAYFSAVRRSYVFTISGSFSLMTLPER